jgi:hypothetical protein
MCKPLLLRLRVAVASTLKPTACHKLGLVKSSSNTLATTHTAGQ